MSFMKQTPEKLLTGVSSAYVPKGYISEMILPTITHSAYNGLLAKYGSDHLRIENAVIGGEGKYRRTKSRTRLSTGFLIEGHGLEGMVTKQDYANTLDPFNAERDEVMGLTTILWLEKEKALADTLTSTGTISQNVTLSGTDQWSDKANSKPLDDVQTGINTILDATGEEPNIGILDLKTYRALKYHPQLLDSLGFKYDRPGGLKQDELAMALGLDKIFFAEARYNSAKEGQTAVMAPVWGKHFVLAVAPPSAAIMQQSIGYMVRLEGSSPRKVYKEAQFNPPGSNKFLVEDEYDMLISNASCAYLIKNAIA